MVEELIKLIFQMRDQTHYLHLVTSSKAQHDALGAFYEQLVELGDGLIEKCIALDKRPTKQLSFAIDPSAHPESSLRKFMQELKKFRGKSAATDADIDELEAQALQTIYMLGLK